jgi:integrase
MLAACKDWTEKLALGVLAYTGARLSSAANLRISDYNPDLRKLRFEEKGSKTPWKRVPEPLALLIEQSLLEPRSLGWKLDKGRWVHRGYRKVQPDDYLIPSATSHRKVKRDNRVVSGAVRRVSERTGIPATPHSFRRAYAVHFLESFPGELETLRVNMGHTRLETTQTYLRALNRDAALERNREFDWTEKTGISEELMETVLEAEKEGFEPSIFPPLEAVKPSPQPDPLVDDLVGRIKATERDGVTGQ